MPLIFCRRVEQRVLEKQYSISKHSAQRLWQSLFHINSNHSKCISVWLWLKYLYKTANKSLIFEDLNYIQSRIAVCWLHQELTVGIQSSWCSLDFLPILFCGVQKQFFISRNAFIVLTGSDVLVDSMISADLYILIRNYVLWDYVSLINGLVSNSSDNVPGTEITYPSRACCTCNCAKHCCILIFEGSTLIANYPDKFKDKKCLLTCKFLIVYSCPTNSLIVEGSLFNLSYSIWYICAAFPSKNRPHPPKNKVSPVKAACALGSLSSSWITYDKLPVVWQGQWIASTRSLPNLKESPSLSLSVIPGIRSSYP